MSDIISKRCRLCSIDKCDKPHYGKGYCRSHYSRLRRNGDPLGGRTPRGELARWIHEVALSHSSDACLAWPFGNNGDGYGLITVGDKQVIASRYVCELAHGTPPTPKHEAAHSCGKGNEGCVAPGHLSWKTHKENMADRLVHGTHCLGERNAHAKLTDDDVRAILSLKGEVPQWELAERYGVSPSSISSVHTGRRWSRVVNALRGSEPTP